MPAVESAGQKVGDVFGPWAAEIIVAAHGVDGSNVGQLGEDVRVADVAGVDDEVTALERADGFGAEEILSVGYHGGFHGQFSVDVSGRSDCFRLIAVSRECVLKATTWYEMVRMFRVTTSKPPLI